MKKVLLILVVAVATFFSANAQVYVGGSLSFQSNTDIEPKSSFFINPEIGYYINQKFDVGLDFFFQTVKYQADVKGSSWGIAPYARYSFFQFGKFDVIGKGSVGFSFYDSSGKSTNFNFLVSPILAYSLTEKIVLFTQLNCLSLSFVSGSPDGGESWSRFGFGASTNNLVNTSNLPIGFIYKF